MEEEQKKDSSFGWKDFWIGVGLGCMIGLIGMLFTKAATFPDNWRWGAIGVLGVFAGLSRRWKDAGNDLTSLIVGFSFALWVWISVAWEIIPGLWPSFVGAIGFSIGIFIRKKRTPANQSSAVT